MASLSGRLAPGSMVQGALRMRGGKGLDPSLPPGDVLRAPTRFRWADAGLAPPDRTFSFELVDEGSGATVLEEQVRVPEFVIPASVRLEPGRAYLWRIEYRDANGRRRVRESGFKLATADVAAEWDRLRPGGDTLPDLVLYAALLSQAGFAADASRLWREIAQRRPESAGVGALAQP
jgi:hypothetical protein